MVNRKRNIRSKKTKHSKLVRSRSSRTQNPQTLAEYAATTDRFKETWNRAEHAISKMRSEGMSLQGASRHFDISPKIVIRLAGSALRKNPNGKYRAKSTDKLLRVLVILTNSGLQEIAVLDSREASLVGKYWAAVEKYLESGDESALRKIRRKTFTDANGKRIRLIKNVAELERLGSAGVLSFESLYAKAA
jgi:hypothetical protein